MVSVFTDRTRARVSIALAASTVLAGMCAVGIGLEHTGYISSAAVASASPPRQLAIPARGSANASEGTAPQPSPGIAAALAAQLPAQLPTQLAARIAAQLASVQVPQAALLVAQAAPSARPNVNVAALDINVSNSRVDKWVGRLATSLKGEFEKSLTRMDRYASMITSKLDERGMPHELTYLAMIESDFNPNARSQVGAVGLWQFMGGTARRFGLKVGHGVDERKDPSAETDAALTYLSDLYHRFGSWYLAAAAYNSGEGTVARALKRVTGRTSGTDADFFRILPELPRETQDYVPKLIASARIGNDPKAYGVAAPATLQATSSSIADIPAAPDAATPASAPTVTSAVAVTRSANHGNESRHTSRRAVRHHATTAHRKKRRRAR